jgi:hypothetical protein
MISEKTIQEFKPVSLEEMDQLALMNRTDTKYFFHESKLDEILLSVMNNYKILEINSCRIMPYSSLYFDTPDFNLYLWHHNGRADRFKVRLRDYLISDKSFFEIKHKTNHDRTKKKRIEVPFKTGEISVDAKKLLHKYPAISEMELVPKLANKFHRITLAGFESQERVTIDTNLAYSFNGSETKFPGIVITEIKKSGAVGDSPFAQALRKAGIFPCGFSKYCMGVVSLYRNVRYNNFKPKLNKLNKILNEYT